MRRPAYDNFLEGNCMSRCTSIAAIITVLCFTAPLGAQVTTGNATRPDSVQLTVSGTREAASTTASQDASEVHSKASVGPTREGTIVGLRLRPEDVAPVPSPAPGKNSENKALMIVGGAAFIAGALIGGDAGTIIMIGGAGFGLYGLWQYLR